MEGRGGVHEERGRDVGICKIFMLNSPSLWEKALPCA